LFAKYTKTKEYVDRNKNETIKLQNYGNNLLQHLQRMRDYRVPKQTWKYDPQGKRYLGRPEKRWSDQL
jgi:hypothetical protein